MYKVKWELDFQWSCKAATNNAYGRFSYLLTELRHEKITSPAIFLRLHAVFTYPLYKTCNTA